MITALLERMPECHRASHRAAKNWGEFPHNGAERVRMQLAEAERVSFADLEYDHIVADSVEVGADEGDSESLATRAIGVSVLLRERVTLDGGSRADASELYDACDVALWEPERASSAGAFVLRGHRGDIQWEVRVVVDQLDGHPIQVALLEDAPPTERTPQNMGLTDDDVALIAWEELIAEDLIAVSRSDGEIQRHPYSAALAYALTCACEDCEEPAQGDLMYWGYDWRVYLTR